MTIENDTLQTIADALLGIQAELKTLNQQMGQQARASKQEAAAGSHEDRKDFRPRRGVGGGRSGGPSKFSKGGPKPFKGGSNKPPRKPG